MFDSSRWSCALSLCLLLASGSAHADKLMFTGTHGITFTPNFGIASEVTAVGTGVATVNGGSSGSSTLSTLQLTQDFAQLDETIPIPTSAVGLYTKIPEIRLTGVRIDPQAAGGLFAPILARFQSATPPATPDLGTMPAAGQIKLCKEVTASCNNAFTGTLSQTTTMGAPVGIGVGGAFTIGGQSSPTRFTIIGQPWTVNTVSVTYRTPSNGTAMLTGMGFVEGPNSNTGTTLSPTSSPMSGTVQLVTAVQIHTTGIPGPHDLSGQIIRLTVHFEPEPGRLLLFGAGAAVLALLGLRKRRA